MAFKGEQRKEFSTDLYTGLQDFKIIAFNPTKEQLDNDIYPGGDSRDPVYTSVGEDGQAKLRVDIFIKNEEHNIITKATYFLEDKVRDESQNNPGSCEWINEVGQTYWTTSEDGSSDYQWIIVGKNPRRAMVGEADLYGFLLAWTNLKPSEDSEIKLSTTWSDLVKGNVKELNQMIGMFKNSNDEVRGVRHLMGVKAVEDKNNPDKFNYYQDVYTKVVLPEGSNYTKGLRNQVTGEYGWKSDFQDSFEFQVFKVPMGDPTPSSSN